MNAEIAEKIKAYTGAAATVGVGAASGKSAGFGDYLGEVTDAETQTVRERYGKEAQIAAFRGAGKRAGEYFARYFLDTSLPFDRFVGDLQAKMQAEKIGILRIEEADEASGRLVLTVSEDADCSGLPVLGETVCNYDEGFLSGVLSLYSGKPYTAVEVDCWATGDRVCRFCAEVKEKL